MSESGVVARILRRLQHMVVIGRTTTAIDDSGGIQTVQAQLFPDLAVRDRTKIMGLAGLSSSPPAGTDLVMVFLNGDRSNGLAIATGHQAGRRKGIGPGDTVVFDYHGASVTLGANGIVVDGGGRPMTFTNASKGRFTFPIESTGEVTALADGIAVHLSSHTHADAQGGSVGLPKG